MYGLRRLLRRFAIHPNAYYNYLRNRKSAYYKQKQKIKDRIIGLYHKNHGILGYGQIKIFLEREGICISNTTCHKYMNTELKLYSITRRKKSGSGGKHHEVFDNLINRNFTAEQPNRKWCVDFTYLFMQNGNKRYNCTIIDLYDRSVVGSVTGRDITAELAKAALSKAIKDNPSAKGSGLILHSDQGSQFTSKEFIEACKGYGIQQSMSRAGCPYDNAPMERYFNTLKSELIYNYTYNSDERLNEAISDFAYVWYNHVRPHSYNGGLTPVAKRKSYSSVYAAKAA